MVERRWAANRSSGGQGGLNYRPKPYVPPAPYASAEARTATAYGTAYDATVRVDWPLDEALLGLTDEQLGG